MNLRYISTPIKSLYKGDYSKCPRLYGVYHAEACVKKCLLLIFFILNYPYRISVRLNT
jgi:hypothetical protein